MDDTQDISAADVAETGGVEAASGVGAASDASVSIVEAPVGESKIARLERELRDARIEDEKEFPRRHVESAQAAVAKAEAALAAAQLSLRQAHQDNAQAEARKQRIASGEEENEVIAGSDGSDATDEASPTAGEGESTTEPEG